MGRRMFFVLVLAVFACPFAGYAEEHAKTEDGGVLAVVNGTKITMADFNTELSAVPAGYRGMINANKRKFLDQLILKQLLYQEAEAKGLAKDKDVIALVEEMKKKIMAQKLIEKEVLQAASISEEELKKYYNDNKDKYKEPEQIHAAHILIKVRKGADKEEDKKAKEKAKGILEKIKAGAGFADTAREYSDGPSGSKGGDLGYFRKGQMVPEFEKAAFALKKGEVSGLVKTKFGYHIIKVLDKKAERQKEFEDVKGEIEKQLLNRKKRDAFVEYTDALKKKAKITVNEDLLKK